MNHRLVRSSAVTSAALLCLSIVYLERRRTLRRLPTP